MNHPPDLDAIREIEKVIEAQARGWERAWHIERDEGTKRLYGELAANTYMILDAIRKVAKKLREQAGG